MYEKDVFVIVKFVDFGFVCVINFKLFYIEYVLI